jgi:hypothetical protein
MQASPTPTPTPFKHIFIAVHGIGAQMRNATVRSVATRLAGSQTLVGKTASPLVSFQPLGYFFNAVKDVIRVRPLDENAQGDAAGIGFAESFWADLPQDVVKEGRTLEETKAWARTVVARARIYCDRARKDNNAIVEPDFDLGIEVLDEIIQTIHVIENILSIADRMGLVHFELKEILDEYVNDVQIVTEFESHRREIIGRFHTAMDQIYRKHCEGQDKPAKLHIVAHSEGTVVSLLGLLHAMHGEDFSTNAASPNARPTWLQHVHGYMTIGSPIDKHLLLWPGLWRDLQPGRANVLADVIDSDGKVIERANRHQIRWRNYYDFGDPVGFKLETARTWIKLREAHMFEFEEQHDIGFARYLLPGKAHNDYWSDPEVFEHFVQDVVDRKTGDTTPLPKRRWNRRLVAAFSPLLPYAFSAVILMVGVYLLYKNVNHFVFGELDAMSSHLLLRDLGLTRTEALTGIGLFWNVIGITALIAGATLLARVPRLASTTPHLHRSAREKAKRAADAKKAQDPQSRGAGQSPARPGRVTLFVWRYVWRAAAVLGFGAGCALYAAAVEPDSQAEIGFIFGRFGDAWPTIGIFLCALAVGAVGYLTTVAASHVEARRDRWIWKGMRPLILSGALIIGIIVTSQIKPDLFGWSVWDELAQKQKDMLGAAKIDKEFLREARFDLNELTMVFAKEVPPAQLGDRLRSLAPILTERPPLWPVFLATAAFLYLWWLATLLFDLAFVWQRYIRQSVCVDGLAEWVTANYWDPKTEKK